MDNTEYLTEKWKSAFPLLVTAEWNNKPSVGQVTCVSIFPPPLRQQFHHFRALNWRSSSHLQPSHPCPAPWAVVCSSPTAHLALLSGAPDAGNLHPCPYQEGLWVVGHVSLLALLTDWAGCLRFSVNPDTCHLTLPPTLNQAFEGGCVCSGGCNLTSQPLVLPTTFLLLFAGWPKWIPEDKDLESLGLGLRGKD